eukprot:scaffold3666_cov160-Amphora_coffeaeformis.AAC.10
MGNTASSPPKKSSKRSSKSRDRKRESEEAENVATRAQKVVGESVQNLSENLQSSIKKLEEEDHPAAQFLDSVCGGYLDPRGAGSRTESFYSDYDDETISEVDDETTATDYRDRRSRRSRRRDEPSVGESASYGESDLDSEDVRRKKAPSNMTSESYESEESSRKHGVVNQVAEISANSTAIQPLASSFAKRCYFTKAGIGKTTQHYEGLTLTGNVVLMLAAAMKLKGCPTICDEDLRRVEQTYPNQFSRLPDELLLSSGWRRISKYCHFSNKPIPDGVPFFHSKQRLHPSGGFYFLLAAAVGMVRPIDVEPLTRDTLVLLETDYPTTCDSAPRILIQDPNQWTLVDKFCFFSGGPINTEEDVYYQADFDGNPIFMLAFLSPSLSPEELYKLDQDTDEPGLKTCAAVEEVESVYDLTERDFDDLRLYHLGPCRALPPFVLEPASWMKVLPPHFLAARQTAMMRAQEFERQSGMSPQMGAPHSHQFAPHSHMATSRAHFGAPPPHQMAHVPHQQPPGSHYGAGSMPAFHEHPHMPAPPLQSLPAYSYPPTGQASPPMVPPNGPENGSEDVPEDEEEPDDAMDLPEDEPPSLSKRPSSEPAKTFLSGEPTGTYSSDLQSGSNLVYSDTDNHGESYEETDYSSAPTKSESRDSYGRDVREGNYYSTSQSESVLSPGGPYEDQHHPAYQFGKTVDPEQHHVPPVPPHHGYSQSGESHQEGHSTYDSWEQHAELNEGPGYQDEQYALHRAEEAQHFLLPGGRQGVQFGYPGENSESYQRQQQQDPSFESYPEEADENTRDRSDLPPVSPRSQQGSEQFSHTSNAMRGAQELLKRNRQKRLEMASRRNDGVGVRPPNNTLEVATRPKDLVQEKEKDVVSPQSETTWESSSEVSGTSSAWTDGSTNAERSSRRALILQMAKARMKKNTTPKPADTKPVNAVIVEDEEEKKLDSAGEDDVAISVGMTRTNSLNESGTDIDISQDLD